MSAYTGYLIRRERLAQNLSQEGLCRGICAVSYLSKIEQGLVEPGQDIMDRLFAALHIEFVRDPALEEEAQRQLEQFFFLSEADESYEEQKAFFNCHGERLARSEFALSYGVFQLCVAADEHLKDEVRIQFEKLEPFLDCMPLRVRQEALLAFGRKTDSPQEAVSIFERAAQLMPNCVVLNTLANCYCSMGQYGKSAELTEQALSLAFAQGNALVMMRCCLRQGLISCTQYDMEQAERHYERAIAWTRGTRRDVRKYVYYNLGSTYLELGDEKKALDYLEQVEEAEDNAQHNMLLHQKLAILYARCGDRKNAQKEIEAAKRHLQEAEQLDIVGSGLFRVMVRFAELMLDKDTKNSPEYEEILRTLYLETMDAFGHSFRQFYGRYYVEMLKGQRRYKEALRIQGEIAFPKNMK